MERGARPRASELLAAGGAATSPRCRARRRSSRPTGSRSSSAPGSARTRPCYRRRSPTGSTRSAPRSPRSATRGRSSSSATSPSTTARRSSTSGSRPHGGTARKVLYEQPDGEGRGRGADQRRRRHAPPGSRATSARPLPSICRARRTAAASPTHGARQPTASRSMSSRALWSSRATRRPSTRACARSPSARTAVIGIGMFEESFRGLADLVLPGTSYLERDGTTVNLEGRLQRQRRAVIAPCPDELAWIAKLAERFERRALAARLAGLRRGRRQAVTAASPSATSASTRRCRAPAERRRRLATPPTKTRRRGQGPAAPHVQAALLRARGRAHAGARLPAARRRGRARPRRRARRAGSPSGDLVRVCSNGTSRRRCAPGSRATCRPGRVRIAAATRPACTSSWR